MDINQASSPERRYDVDAIRSIALLLLIIYHVAITFQPWAQYINFIQNDESLTWMWAPMSLINIWRIPILFMVSGMGARFAMERRDWKKFLIDRGIRIGIPLLFGFFFVCPVTHYFFLKHYETNGAYVPNAGHLWFLINILCYVLYCIGFYWAFVEYPENVFIRSFRRFLERGWTLYLLAVPLILEAVLVNPESYPNFTTPHGHFVGMICFILGFLFICLKDSFWVTVQKTRWISLILAATLYVTRLFVYEFENVPNYSIAFESFNWMMAVFGFSSLYLNKKSAILSYLSRAVFPVYIVHFPIQYAISYYLIPLSIAPELKLFILTTGTFTVSFMLFEIIKRLKWIRPLFGMKINYS